jgi:hypothetical protein
MTAGNVVCDGAQALNRQPQQKKNHDIIKYDIINCELINCDVIYFHEHDCASISFFFPHFHHSTTTTMAQHTPPESVKVPQCVSCDKDCKLGCGREIDMKLVYKKKLPDEDHARIKQLRENFDISHADPQTALEEINKIIESVIQGDRANIVRSCISHIVEENEANYGMMFNLFCRLRLEEEHMLTFMNELNFKLTVSSQIYNEAIKHMLGEPKNNDDSKQE